MWVGGKWRTETLRLFGGRAWTSLMWLLSTVCGNQNMINVCACDTFLMGLRVHFTLILKPS